jgi:hypothetical protein
MCGRPGRSRAMALWFARLGVHGRARVPPTLWKAEALELACARLGLAWRALRRRRNDSGFRNGGRDSLVGRLALHAEAHVRARAPRPGVAVRSAPCYNLGFHKQDVASRSGTVIWALKTSRRPRPPKLCTRASAL